MKLFQTTGLLLSVLLSCCRAAAAESLPDKPLLHPLFSDHIVLQRDVAVPVWGWTQPGAKIMVTFAGQTRPAIADADGKWIVTLQPMAASTEPRVLMVTASVDGGTATINDVLVGDVWLCSGQSNMEMGVELCNVTNDIAAADFPRIRLLTVPHRIATGPVPSVSCRWFPCSPETIRLGSWKGFSAAAFFFGRELHQQLDVPIGLIHSSWGGTVAEAWTSAEALEPLGDFQKSLEWVREAGRISGPDAYTQMYERWCQTNDPGTRQGFQKSDAADADWQTVTMPQEFARVGLGDFDGIVWFRHEFDLPEALAGQDLQLYLGNIDDIDTTWINGVKVGQMNKVDLVRRYPVPASLLKPGRNVIAIRVLDTVGFGGMTARAIRISPRGDSDAEPVSLGGSWKMRASAPLSQSSPVPPAPDSNNPNVPTVLYNGMIAPLLPFAIKGAIWYQGEANADRAKQYQRLLPAMIEDWRQRFGVGDFPFYIVQLAAWQATSPEPRTHPWAELREAQALTADHVRNSGLAVAIDVGDANDIHPKDKKTVGHRLALVALAKTYGKKIEYSGPRYRSMKVSGSGIRLQFDHADGLIAKGGKLAGFAIAGEDHKFVWADATIDGDAVLVSSPAVSKPVAVRYAWDINPVCNLYNQAGLPAVPFRTDK